MADNNHVLLARIDERVGNINKRMNDFAKDMKSQDIRIRALEKWRWGLSGALTLLGLGFTMLGGKVLFW